MTKTITLKSGKKNLTIPYKQWREALDLAQLNGWHPVDTLAPEPYPFQERWDGAYEWPCGQTVPLGAALTLADALASASIRFSTLITANAKAQLGRLARFCGKDQFQIIR
jgi:hypothetical protein